MELSKTVEKLTELKSSNSVSGVFVGVRTVAIFDKLFLYEKYKMEGHIESAIRGFEFWGYTCIYVSKISEKKEKEIFDFNFLKSAIVELV